MKFNSVIYSALALGTVALAANVMPAEAALFNFQNIAGGDTFGDSIVNQFQMEVDQESAGKVFFKFSNTGSVASFISQIYWDKPSASSTLLSGNPVFDQSSGVLFEKNTGNLNLPQGNNINFTADLGVKAKNPAPQKGINNTGNEWLKVVYNGNATDVISALKNSSLRVGFHAQGIGPNSKSDAYYNQASEVASAAVPEPLTILGSGMALGFGALFQKKRGQKNKELS